jgi:hypothetical protein
MARPIVWNEILPAMEPFCRPKSDNLDLPAHGDAARSQHLQEPVVVHREEQRMQQPYRRQAERQPVGDKGKVAAQRGQAESYHLAHAERRQYQRRRGSDENHVSEDCGRKT